MANKRWILRFSGDATAISKARLNTLLKGSSIHVIDMSLFPKYLLVEGPEEKVNEFTTNLDSWTYSPEKSYNIPDTKKKIKTKHE